MLKASLVPQGNWRDKSFQYTDPNGNVVADTVVKGRFSGVVNFVTGAHAPRAAAEESSVPSRYRFAAWQRA